MIEGGGGGGRDRDGTARTTAPPPPATIHQQLHEHVQHEAGVKMGWGTNKTLETDAAPGMS